MDKSTDESKNDRFKVTVAILIAIVSVVGAIGGARAGLLGSIDNELTRTGLLNQVRQQQIDLSHRLTALDQTLYAQQFAEQQHLADLTQADAVEARQQGRAAEARALEEQADASRSMVNHLRDFFYADYQRPGSGYDAGTLTEDLKLSMSARTYKTLKPEDYIQRGDDQGAIGIACMLALAIASVSLVFFGLADMINRRIKYVFVVLGLAVLAASVYMLVTA